MQQQPGVEAAGREVDEVQGRRDAPNVADDGQQRRQDLRHVALRLQRRVEAEPDDRLGEPGAVRGAKRLAVQFRAGTAHRGECLLRPGIVYHGDDGVGAVLQRDAHRPGAGPGDVVPGAVERVDDPSAAAGACAAGAFLGDQAVGGEFGAQAVGDEALAGEVDVGDEIVGVRLPAVDRQCGPLAYLQPSGLAGEFDGRRERRPEIGLEHVASLPHPGAVNHSSDQRPVPWSPSLGR